MYTNELLKEKYKAQKDFAEKAEREGKPYQTVVEEEVRELFKRKGWKMTFSKREGCFLGQGKSRKDG